MPYAFRSLRGLVVKELCYKLKVMGSRPDEVHEFLQFA
jgi:hypothetical protein